MVKKVLIRGLLFSAIASISLSTLAAGVDVPVNTYRSFRVTTPNFTDRFLRHQDGVGVTSVIDTASSRTDRLDGTFLITVGLADKNCYSFKSNNKINSYLRHKDGIVSLDDRSTDAYQRVFDQDATWCAVPGLSGSNISFQSKNFPEKYLRHVKGQLALTDAGVVPYSFRQDATWALSPALTDVVPVAYPVAGKSSGSGKLPVRVAKVDTLGEISSNKDFPRDVGFSGVVNGHIIWSFADTLRGAGGFCASNSSALGDYGNPLRIIDKDVRSNGCPREWLPFYGKEIPEGVSRWNNWITNVVEYAPNKGLVWYIKRELHTSECNPECPRGAGVATVSADDGGAVAVRTSETVWNNFEPLFGGRGAAYDARDGYVYVYGASPVTMSNTYLARALPADVADAGKYQYFDNSTKTWGSNRFTQDGRYGTVAISEKQAIFTGNSFDQTTPFWSNYYNTWMMAYGDKWSRTNIYIMTAPHLEGPWIKSSTVNIDTCILASCANDGQWHYAVAGHPEYDPSGKTLVVTWSTWKDNKIYAKKITFE